MVGEYGKVWWVPDDGNVDVDYAGVEWDNVNIEEIPVEQVEKHPEANVPDRLDRLQQRAESAVDISGLSLLLGAVAYGIAAAVNLPFIAASTETGIQTFGAVAFVFGVFLIGIALLLFGATAGGRVLEERGADATLAEIKEGVTSWIVGKTGYQIVRVDDRADD